jgi:phage-related protein (TIGR01555 family)
LVDQPVDDGFRGGVEIRSGQLDAEQIKTLQQYCEQSRVLANTAQAVKWSRLFGGGGIIVLTSQDPKTPLNPESFNKHSKVEFRAVDMWELYYTKQSTQWSTTSLNPVDPLDIGEDFYNYYGFQIHKSRVFRINGKEAPSFIRPRLRGWGMSELERLVRSINQYFKNQDVIFELMDEAKVDVYRMDGFNAALMNKNGTESIQKRIQMGNVIKNYNNALTMDMKDEYEQKQMTFTGLAEMLVQNRINIAADLKMPVTKLFGISSAGFNSGEDDIENYNSMVDTERGKVKFMIVDMLKICCQKLFEFIPDDLQVEFQPLRILSAEQEEKVKDSQFNRTMSAWQSGLVGTEETKKAINKDVLLPVEIDDTLEAVDAPVEGDFTTAGQNQP